MGKRIRGDAETDWIWIVAPYTHNQSGNEKSLWSGLKCMVIFRPSRGSEIYWRWEFQRKTQQGSEIQAAKHQGAVTVAVGVSGHKNKFQ